MTVSAGMAGMTTYDATHEPGAEPERGCFVYAVVSSDADTQGDQPPGLDETPLRLVAHGDIAAVVNDVLIERPSGRRADLMAYHRVLDRLAREGPVVPVRFGAVLLDDEEVRESVLRPAEQDFAVLLKELDGRSQYTLRATYQDGVPLREIVSLDPVVGALRERTRGLSESESYAERVELGERVAAVMADLRAFDADVLLQAVAPFARDHVLMLGTGLDALATVSLLVDDERVPKLESHLEGLAAEVHERIRLALTGPTAPFDFVGRLGWA